MALVDVVAGEKLLILVGDGVTPTEGFAHPCLINAERGISFSASMVSETVPDCAAPDEPGWQQTEKDGLSATITGAGMLDVASVAAFDEWFSSKDTKNVKVKIDKAGGSTWTGAFHLSEWQITGTRKNKATCSITLVSDGPVTRAANT